MELINLTPHDINVELVDGRRVSIPRSGRLARVAAEVEPAGTLSLADCNVPVPLVRAMHGDVEGLPDPQEDTVYIVSTRVLLALREKGVMRDDVVAPDTGPTAIRLGGHIQAVRRFVTL